MKRLQYRKYISRLSYMKYSIRLKITCLLTALIICTIFLTWFINLTFLGKFYSSSKLKTMDLAYKAVKEIFEKNKKDELSEEEYENLNKLVTKFGVDIYVYSSFDWFYPLQEDIGFGERKQIEFILSGLSPDLENKNIEKKIKNKYVIYSLYDRQRDAKYLDLYGIVEDNKIIFIRTNVERIEESVAISNKFLAYIGIIAALFGTVIMMIASKKFTDPILDLAAIAKKMSDLNFDVKYQVKSKDEIGELGRSINTLSDKLETTITELKQANNELLLDIQEKTEVDEMRKEFLSNVSHELKTPLALIQGYAEGLKENINEDEESREFYCEVIMDEADKMNKMVKKLLSLNELEFGTNQVNLERFDIVTLIRSVLYSTEILFKQKEVVLHFEEQGPVYVWADEFMIEQVMTNYISNALNHAAGAKIIEIKLIQQEDVVRIAVFNTGEQIPEDALDKIWIKFYKTDKARTREYGGSGIGLSIVKAVMKTLNRECGVINRQTGVEFWIELDSRKI